MSMQKRSGSVKRLIVHLLLYVRFLAGVEAAGGREVIATDGRKPTTSNRRRDGRAADPQHRLPVRANVSGEAAQHGERGGHAARRHGQRDLGAHSPA